MPGDKFDCLVVGAGPGGSAAALVMARAGLSVLLLERGEAPGTKNVQGGLLFRKMLDDLIPGFWKEAPVERRVIAHEMWLTSEDAAVTVRYQGADREPYNGFTVLRARFDPWFAKKAEEAGALLLTGTVVEDFLRDGDGRIAGIRTGQAGPEGEVRADCVILADGVNSLLMPRSGLRKKDLETHQVTLCVKEVIGLPPETIDARFNLEAGQGTAIQMVGAVTQGMVGMAFLYTNTESVSIGLGCVLKEFVRTRVKPDELLEVVKSHPRVRPLIAGGTTLEYSAHMIPAGGSPELPRLFTDRLLAVGDAGALVNSASWEGANFAMLSGRLAAETVIEAKAKGDFSAHTMAGYQRRLEASVVLKDIRHFGNLIPHVETHPHFFSVYPRLATEVAHEFFTVDGVSKKEKERKIMRGIHKARPVWKIAGDLLSLWRGLK